MFEILLLALSGYFSGDSIESASRGLGAIGQQCAAKRQYELMKSHAEWKERNEEINRNRANVNNAYGSITSERN